jgi:S1-C subfamily serine protease
MRRVVMSAMTVLLAAAAARADKPPPLGPNELPGPSTASPPAQMESRHHVAATGSGFVAVPGVVLTNAHVVRGCTEVLARNAAGRTARVGARRIDTDRDLALLKVPASFGPALTFRDSPQVLRGESVVTYGFPLTGLLSTGPTLTTGSVSALTGLRDDPLDYTISAPVQPGNSGGPLFDAQGHVIGVVVAKLNAAEVARITGGDIPQNVNFAIKGDVALAFLREAGLSPVTAASTGAELHASTVGEIANPATAFVECVR